ncbi:hypothetical protein V1527DRAFT_492908 [Lipomyces starkeyi]
MWSRFTPLARALRIIYRDIQRTFSNFGLDIWLGSLPPTSRLRNPALGAGSLLDIGIYLLTWGLLTLEDQLPHWLIEEESLNTFAPTCHLSQHAFVMHKQALTYS